MIEKLKKIELKLKEIVVVKQDEHGPESRLVAYYEETVKILEFRAGLSQGITTGAGPYKGKQM